MLAHAKVKALLEGGLALLGSASAFVAAPQEVPVSLHSSE